jgi:hypothetical protein
LKWCPHTVVDTYHQSHLILNLIITSAGQKINYVGFHIYLQDKKIVSSCNVLKII